MSFEERKKYYESSYEDYGLPENVSCQEFFDTKMIDYLSKKPFYAIIRRVDLIELLKIYSNNQQNMNKIIEMMCKYGCSLNSDIFNEIMNNDSAINTYIKALYTYLSNNSNIKASMTILIVNNEEIFNRIINDNIINVDIFKSVFTNSMINKNTILMLLKYEKMLAIFFNYSLYDFLSVINNNDLSQELSDLIQKKISSSSYQERLSVVKNKRLYNPETGNPEYMQELYSEMKDKIISDTKRGIISALRVDSSIEEKNKALEFLNTSEGMSIFLREILEPQFSNVINILNLDKSLYQARKLALMQELNDYTKYDLSTIKELLCQYCFNDNCNNIKLRLKTLIEYASENNEALNLMRDNINYFIKLYSFLASDSLECNPINLISNINLNELIYKVHDIFRKEVNKKTDISDILSSSNYKEINGVKVFDVDIPLSRSYFLVHSDRNGYELENYRENAKKYDRICTSILDNNHLLTFLDGIVFGYCNIEAPVYSAIPFDGQTNQRMMASGKAQYRSVLSDVERFTKRTRTYNELTYETNNEIIMPSYIFVANREPNDLELRIAKEYNIPIFVYHQKEISYEHEDGYTRGEPFDYEHSTFDYVPNEVKLNVDKSK